MTTMAAALFCLAACGGGETRGRMPPGASGQEAPQERGDPGSRSDSALVAAARQVGAFLRGRASFDTSLFKDTVELQVAPEGGGAQRAVASSELAERSGWTVGGRSLVPPADDRELAVAVGRHLSCVEAPLATRSERLARLPHVGMSLRPAEGGSCLQSWTLTLVFDTTAGSPRVVAALYDQWEW